MRNLKTEAIVIRRSDTGEADKIITVFTKNKGKLKIKAKGVRKVSSRRGAHIELLNYCIISLYSSGRMPILTEIQSVNSFNPHENRLKRIGAAFHICELIDSLCAENQESRLIFNLLKETLIELEHTQKIDELLAYFEKELLDSLGFWPRSKKLDSKNSQYIIESIIERKLRSKKIMSSFS